MLHDWLNSFGRQDLMITLIPNGSPESVSKSNHVTLLETSGDGALIGFVDGFSTASSEGVCRWEVDLLGVHPDHRGRGVAQRLIRASVAAGRELGAATARALVKLDNAASRAAFLRCGFAPDETVCDLYVSDQAAAGRVSAPEDAYLIPVSTLTYGGVWVEGVQSAEALRAAQRARTRYGWDFAGAVIPVRTLAMAETGYALVGEYRWLRLGL